METPVRNENTKLQCHFASKYSQQQPYQFILNPEKNDFSIPFPLVDQNHLSGENWNWKESRKWEEKSVSSNFKYHDRIIEVPSFIFLNQSVSSNFKYHDRIIEAPPFIFLKIPQDGERLTSRDLKFPCPSIVLKKVKITKGTSSSQRRIQVVLMGCINFTNICLAICYSRTFFVKSHQNQLSDDTQAQRKLLLVNKRRKISTSTPSSKRVPSLSGGFMKDNSRLFISNVCYEQVQDRNLMGESAEEGRYPIVHYDYDFLVQELQQIPNIKIWFDINLVTPLPEQQTEIFESMRNHQAKS